MQRYHGHYANRTRGERHQAGEPTAETSAAGRAQASAPELPSGGVSKFEPAAFSRRDARRRWAGLIRLVSEVDPLECPSCGGQMRAVALIQDPPAIDRILAHLRDKGRDPRAGAWATGPPGPRGGGSAEAGASRTSERRW